MKKIIAFVLTALLCLQFAACVKIQDPEPEPQPESAQISNNGGRYVSYGGDVYYWEDWAACIDHTATWGDFPQVPGIRRSLARNNESLFIDKGCGNIWIFNERFYFTYLDDDYTPHIVSAAMEKSEDGEAIDRRELGVGEIFALDEARGLFIITDLWEDGLLALDAATGERDYLTGYAQPLLYDAHGGKLYYRFFAFNEAEEVVLLRCVDVATGEERDVAWIEPADFEELEYAQYVEVGGVRLDGDRLYLHMAAYAGTGYHYNGSAFLYIDLAGDAVLINESPTESDWFGVNQPFSSKDGPFENFAGDYFGWYMCPGEGEAPEVVLSEAEIDRLGLPNGPFFGEEGFVDIRDVEYSGGALYFSIVRGPRNPDEDIGWREAYDFDTMHVYRKDLAAGTIDELYSFDKDGMRG